MPVRGVDALKLVRDKVMHRLVEGREIAVEEQPAGELHGGSSRSVTHWDAVRFG